MPSPRPALRVLITDDSPALRELLRDAMGEVDGVDVVGEAGDGRAALREVQRSRPDVLVLDLSMPGMGGVETLVELQQVPDRPRVIVLTNHADDVYREACLTVGADHFFDKSAEIDCVLDVLRALAPSAEA